MRIALQDVGNKQLLVLALASPALCLVLQERIDFSPHPKTLTMAGDYEYFAAQAMPKPCILCMLF